MDTRTSFDGYEYFKAVHAKSKLARSEGFFFCRVAGLGGMEEALNEMSENISFFCVDDTTDGTTVQRNGGFFKRRVFTVFLLKRYQFNDMAERHEAMGICRTLFDKICSRMLVDKERLLEDLIYLNTDRIHFREMEKYFLNGCTGLYFIVDVDEPIDLSYEPDEWEE
jgi:hypothetical protein|nr:MAG TPA: hypothetical protein [Caudoviricetes sp.]